MLNVKKLLGHILARSIHYKDITYTVPALSAGAKGYWNIPIDLPSGYVISSFVNTSTIAATGGLQVTQIFINGTNLYLNYYAPTAISANAVRMTIRISYITA